MRIAGDSGSHYQICLTVSIGCHPESIPDCGIYSAEVLGELTKRKGGRSAKDGALVLRDQYWSLRLKAHLPGESFSSLERILCDTIKVGRRDEGQG